MRAKKNQNKIYHQKQFWLGVGLFLWAVSISGVLGNSGLLQAYRLSQVKHDMRLRVVALENEKLKLNATLKLLDSDVYVQEQAIREVLGFARDSELIFEFK